MRLKEDTRPRILVVGGAQTEIILTPERPAQFTGTEVSPNTVFRPGGRAACMAAALSRLGSRVYFVSCLGADPMAGRLVTELANHGVNVDYVERNPRYDTGLVHHIITPDSAHRRIHTPGASQYLSEEAVHKAIVIFSSVDLVIITADISRKTFDYTVSLAHRFRVPVLVDPDPPDFLQGADLSDCDVLAPDAAAAAALCGWEIKSVGDAGRCAARLLQAGAGAAAIYMGISGVVTSLAPKENTYIPAATGATLSHPHCKSAFNAGLGWALIRKFQLSDAAWFALSCAAAVQPFSPDLSIFEQFPSLEDVAAFQTLEIR